MVSFACDARGRLRPERREPWDRAERAVVPGWREEGLSDHFALEVDMAGLAGD